MKITQKTLTTQLDEKEQGEIMLLNKLTKLIIKNIPKETIELCRIEADKAKYQTAPLTIYKNIRFLFTHNQTINEVIVLGYDEALVRLVHNEVLGK